MKHLILPKRFCMIMMCGFLMMSCNNHSPNAQESNQSEYLGLLSQYVAQNNPAPMKSKKFYQELIEDFCKKYYHKKFPGRSYVYGSLYVDNVSRLEHNIFVVMGTHTFKGRFGLLTYRDREFRATVRQGRNGEYHIRFERRLEIIGHEWVSTGDLPFNYDG